jgi:dTDP-4-amino-4,6-dideoxygalactose transaminase
MRRISYGRQYIDKEDIREAIKVLRSDLLTQGPKVVEFESLLAGYCGAKYAVAVSSGTAALHIACLVAGLKKRDEAITTPMTFAATANSVLYTGAKPVFADINPETANIDARKISAHITGRTKAILPVHYAGLPCDMHSISKIAKKRGIVVIEDACHALGASYKHNKRWVKVGNCALSDMVVFSFHPVKSITTGEGGAVLTDRKELYEKLLMLRSHGITKERSKFTGSDALSCGDWYHEMQLLGFNYRITDFQCAMGISQLKKLDDFIEIGRAHV